MITVTHVTDIESGGRGMEVLTRGKRYGGFDQGVEEFDQGEGGFDQGEEVWGF